MSCRTRSGLAALRRRLSDDAGTSVIETVILAPALILFVGLIVAGGRLAVAHQAVEAAAAEAARSASIARTAGEAVAAAEAAADATLGSQDLTCVSRAVAVDVAGFAVPVGTPASVGVTVTCQVHLADTLPGLPGTLEVTATVRSPLDTFRERR
jgi:Flp pilus assembly protein TadG